MGKDEPIAVKDAIHKIQLCLLDGIHSETQLFAAGSLMSRNDYQDVVTERTIVNMCGYPLCKNSLPSEQPKKGHYRISLKEHKVYDLHETYMYCSTTCVVNSRAFAGSLADERCSVLNSGKLNEILRLFDGLGTDSFEDLKSNGGLEVSNLKIHEKTDTSEGTMSMEEWVGPSNAIEGYVPQHDRSSKTSRAKNFKEGSYPLSSTSSKGKSMIFDEMDFMSTIITQDEYSISKKPEDQANNSRPKGKKSKGKGNRKETKDQIITKGAQSSSCMLKSSLKSSGAKKENSSVTWADEKTKSAGVGDLCEFREFDNSTEALKPENFIWNEGRNVMIDEIFEEMDVMSTLFTQDEYTISNISAGLATSTSDPLVEDLKGDVNNMDTNDQIITNDTPLDPTRITSDEEKSTTIPNHDLRISELSLEPYRTGLNLNDIEAEKESSSQSSSCEFKSSTLSTCSTKVNRSVTWADEKTSSDGTRNLCEFRESDNEKEAISGSDITDLGSSDDDLRFASAEACAMALTHASEAVASGESDGLEAVSEAGIIIMAPPHDLDDMVSGTTLDRIDPEPSTLKWQKNSGITETDFFESEDTWYDSPPEGFNLALSPFATMFTALFAWISSSSLAYIYGHDDSFYEDYSCVNGREYPQKIVLSDGRSSEIKRTLAVCLARAVPGLVSDLRMPVPISTIEQAMACLLDTMSFLDPIPPLRPKQWKLLVLLFIDALSVRRVPTLAPHVANRSLFQKVFDGAQISAEEYDVMKDLLIPLGRAPQMSTQSGG